MAPVFPADMRTPAYVLDVAALKRNLATVERIRRESGAKILLATKAWAMPAAFPMMRDALDGTTASGEYEARLGREEFGKEVHVYAPAYAAGEVERLTAYADHVYFNAPEQLRRFSAVARAAGAKVGIRVNPGYSNATLGGHLYDPCAPCSRFGTLASDLAALPWDEIDIFHVHALCESMAFGSTGLMSHVASHFGPYIRKAGAVNFGGGHFINKAGYDVDRLIGAIKDFRTEFGVEVILEPGGGIVVDTGYLVATVIGLHHNAKDIAILDTSASCHMPDVLEVPYTPGIIGAGTPDDFPHTYILGGKTCMTGDVIGEFAFPEPLAIGSRIVFTDMMQYSFVKSTIFNGTPRPDLAMLDEDGSYRVLRSYGYEDFRRLLG